MEKYHWVSRVVEEGGGGTETEKTEEKDFTHGLNFPFSMKWPCDSGPALTAAATTWLAPTVHEWPKRR